MNDNMKFYANLVYFLKQTLSSDYEIFLFDATDISYPVVAMSAKSRDDEKVARDFVASTLKSSALRARDMVLNQALQPEFGKLVRTSVLFVRGIENEIVGALCVMLPCNQYMKLQTLLESLLQFDLFDEEQMPQLDQVTPVQEVLPGEASMETIEKVFAEMDLDPARLTMEEKLELICDLYDMNAFKVKGGVARVAEHLKMSEQSVYRYINKIKKLRS